MHVHLVDSKGQIVIAKEIRDFLGVEPGWLALQRLVGNHVVQDVSCREFGGDPQISPNSPKNGGQKGVE